MGCEGTGSIQAGSQVPAQVQGMCGDGTMPQDRECWQRAGCERKTLAPATSPLKMGGPGRI